MATLRQLTTRFNFETDTRGVQNFQNVLGGMKKAVVGVALALGAGAAGKAAAQLGVGLEAAAVAAGRFNDEIKLTDGAVKLTGEMADSWERVRENIPGRVNMAPFLRSFVEFRQLLKDRPLEDFNTLFETAGRIAVITGDNVEDTFKRLTRAATSGDFQPLQEIFPNFDILDKSMQGFIQRLLEVDPTNVNNVKISLDRFLAVVRKGAPELDKFSTEVFSGTARAQFAEFGRNLSEIGSLIGLHLAKPMREALKDVNEYFDAWIDGKKTLRELFASIARDMKKFLATSPVFGPLFRLMEKFGTPLKVETKTPVARDDGAFLEDQGPATKTIIPQFGGGLTRQLEQARELKRRRTAGEGGDLPGFGDVLERMVDAIIGTPLRLAKEGRGRRDAESRETAVREARDKKTRAATELDRIRALRLSPSTGSGAPDRETLRAPGVGVEPAPPISPEVSVIQNATFNVVINGAQSPRAVVDELRRAINQASLSFPQLEAANT